MDGLLSHLFAALCLGVAALVLAGRIFNLERRTLGFSVPLVLVVAVAAAFVTFLLRDPEPLPAATLPAVLIASSAFFGYFYNSLLSELNASALRKRKVEDICAALAAEIENETSEGDAIRWDDWIAQIKAEFEADPAYLPLTPVRVRDTVFRTVLGQIELLEPPQIQRVVYYYTLASDLKELAEFMRSDRYASRPPKQRMSMHLALIKLEERLRIVGSDALAEIAPPDQRESHMRRARRGEEMFQTRYDENIRRDQ